MTTRNVLLGALGCVALLALTVGGCALAGWSLFKGAVADYSRANEKAVAFLNRVGAGDDAGAYAMLSPAARKGETLAAFSGRMKTLRADAGIQPGATGAAAPLVTSNASVSMVVHDQDRRYTVSYSIRGSKTAQNVQVEMRQVGDGPWEVERAEPGTGTGGPRNSAE
jgi:hypothetical protein